MNQLNVIRRDFHHRTFCCQAPSTTRKAGCLLAISSCTPGDGYARGSAIALDVFPSHYHRVLVNVHDRQRFTAVGFFLFARIRAAMRLRTNNGRARKAFAARVCGLWREKPDNPRHRAQRVAMHNQHPTTIKFEHLSSGNNVMPLSRAKRLPSRKSGCHE